MKLDTLLVGVADGVATITLNRPHKQNAMNPALHRDMTAALDGAALRFARRVSCSSPAPATRSAAAWTSRSSSPTSRTSRPNTTASTAWPPNGAAGRFDTIRSPRSRS